MAGNEDEAYSRLEVHPYGQLEVAPQHRGQKPLPTDLGKQVVPEDGKQHALERVGIEVDPNGNFPAQHVGDPRVQIHRSSRMKWMPFVGVLALVLIAAAVLGGVFGSRHKNHGTAGNASSTNHSNASISSSPARSTQRNIAALSYSLNSVNNTRVYFQDDGGQIFEAANSADNPKWNISRIGIGGKNGSAMAAAVSLPGFPLVISVFYLDVNNLIHDVSYSPSTRKWASGTLSDHGYTAMANSSLAAMYYQCRGCPSTTIIAFQDTNGFVQIGNLTSRGWTLIQLGPTLDPAMGTALTLIPLRHKEPSDLIDIYYQKWGLNLSIGYLVPNLTPVGGWSLNETTSYAMPAGSPIAAASSYSNVSSGFETWVQVLSICDRGVKVSSWSGAVDDWVELYNVPSVMANSTSDQKVYGAVAVTAIGSAFGVVQQTGHADTIESWQVADDMIDWTSVGNVDLGGIWG